MLSKHTICLTLGFAILKNLIRICLIIILLILANFTLQAQDDFAQLEKNWNIQAQGLIHELNSSKDTLILKSDKIINSLYAINKEYGRELDFRIDANEFKLPLNKLSKGKHVMVAVQSPVRIVFVVKISNNNPKQEPDQVISKTMVAIEPKSTGIKDNNN